MDSKNAFDTGDPDWNDPVFASAAPFEDSMAAESPFGSSAFNDFTNMADYADSPGLQLRNPSKDINANPNAPQHPSNLQSSTSADTSSQDSSSESSSRRKRKTASESPMSDPAVDSAYSNVHVKQEERLMDPTDMQRLQQFDQHFSQPMHNLTLEQTLSDDTAMGNFDFAGSNESSPMRQEYDSGMSLETRMKLPTTNAASYTQDSPVQTINPGMFSIGPSRDQSPATNAAMFNTASPTAIFSTPSSDSNETFNPNQNWNKGMQQNPTWNPEYNTHFTSPNNIFTPSPIATNGATPSVASRGSGAQSGRSKLHIAPISTKSRVETQINVVMTLERPPPGVEYLHLPLHTIAKSKLLAKDPVDQSKALELHVMLVCSSAMRSQELRQKAMQRAAGQNNITIQAQGEKLRDTSDEEKNDPKNVPEDDKPANGGEVRICNNCIQRERKRAGRKKLKKEEEQQHWERFETERVVVFNSSEYLQFKPFENGSIPPQRDSGMGGVEEQPYVPPEGATHVTAAMRIACYCRHQSEKEGFQVVFTMKDQQGNVVAQEMSDSILITDDHKTHPPQFTTNMPGDVFYGQPQFPPHGLPTSYSMVDMSQPMPPFTSSRSTGNLQQLAYGAQQQYNPHSHVHHLPQSGFTSQATSATMTPTSLSRPGSPTSAGQSGPNKKRKSSSFHKRVPSGLQMTPRVDTSQGQASGMPSAVSLTSPFSPTSAGFSGQAHDYMTIPQNGGPAQYFGSGPPTPATEQGAFMFGQAPNPAARLSRESTANMQAFYSAPSSRQQSRASSPVPQSGPNLAAYARQHAHGPPATMNNRQNMFQQPQQQAPGSAGNDSEPAPPPMIHRLNPAEGPTSGGTEVSIYGSGFSRDLNVMFGEQVATAVTFYGDKSLLATSPPGRAGNVQVTLVPSNGPAQYPSPSAGKAIFTYRNDNGRMMELALRFLAQQQTGSSQNWQGFASAHATQYMATNIGRAGIGGASGGYEGGPGGLGPNMFATEPAALESVILGLLDQIDLCETQRQPQYDIASATGDTLLSMACTLGLHRVAAALLARGANPDVRDKGGYTPLMHAALQGRTRTFQLLMLKGADATIRSLKGYVALDLAPVELRSSLYSMLLNTPRARIALPQLRQRLSNGSLESQSSWDISSASFYESEADESSQHALSLAASRRPSAQLSVHAQVQAPTQSPHINALEVVSPTAAMHVWRDALAAQIQHFQQSVHWNVPHLQLPPLPSLPDYQDNAMVRRISSLVPGCSVSRSATPLPHDNERRSTPPPAYNELFPDRGQAQSSNDATKKSGLSDAVIDTVADEKCAAMFDQASSETVLDSSRAAPLQQASATKWSLHQTPWLWMPILVITTSILWQTLLMPCLTGVSTRLALDTASAGSSTTAAATA